MKRSRLGRYNRRAHTDSMKQCQQRLERRVAARCQRPIQRLAGDACFLRHLRKPAIGFGYIAQCEQADGTMLGIVQFFQRRFQVLHRKGPISPQLGNGRLGMGNRSDMFEFANVFLRFQSSQYSLTSTARQQRNGFP